MVFYFANKSKFLCANRAWSSKKWLGVSDISNLLDSSEIIDKLLDANEFLDTDESSDTDFGEQENDALLLDMGENGTAYVSDGNFQWQDMDNYVRQQET
jgi:hypothetical protein